mmetsp:Transcript_112842/g.211586  ORF Transcript_112842/g.211586 Transcript_112842/m.211586 type:complete len:226 (+) Transcript_112842:3-680(+)
MSKDASVDMCPSWGRAASRPAKMLSIRKVSMIPGQQRIFSECDPGKSWRAPFRWACNQQASASPYSPMLQLVSCRAMRISALPTLQSCSSSWVQLSSRQVNQQASARTCCPLLTSAVSRSCKTRCLLFHPIRRVPSLPRSSAAACPSRPCQTSPLLRHRSAKFTRVHCPTGQRLQLRCSGQTWSAGLLLTCTSSVILQRRSLQPLAYQVTLWALPTLGAKVLLMS